MKSLRGNITLICTIGIYTMGLSVYAYGTEDGDTAKEKSPSFTSSILSFFSSPDKEKKVVDDINLIEKPTKENAAQYITLSEPSSPDNSRTDNMTAFSGEKPKNKLTVKQSFVVKPSLIFNMGNGSSYYGLGANSTGNNVTFSYGKSAQNNDTNTIDITIGSQFLVEPSSILSPLYDGSEYENINNRQVYNLSVDMGYAGFKIGASFSQEKKLNDTGLKGFDVGLGYSGQKWGADVKIGEYKRQHDLLFATTEEFYNKVYALEIGAAYQINQNIRFSGRFTYYSYGQESNIEQLKNSQVFFLGTNVNF